MGYQRVEKELFHIHTYRCGHAEEITDETYVLKAIDLGAKRIAFTDHGPFPENPFGNRMNMECLEEYVKTLGKLKEKYRNQIEILIGLEIEYLPSYLEYYRELKESGEFDVLMLGQHFSEDSHGKYSFSTDKEILKVSEAKDCGKAIVEGIQTGLFDVVAHPDRIFRRRTSWTESESAIAKNIIEMATKYGVYLEQNESSKEKKNHYWKEFWELTLPDTKILSGLDAHSLGGLKL